MPYVNACKVVLLQARLRIRSEICFANVFSPFILCLNVFAVVPHITDAIQEWVMEQARISVDDDGVEPQVCVIEVRSSQQVLHVGIQN